MGEPTNEQLRKSLENLSSETGEGSVDHPRKAGEIEDIKVDQTPRTQSSELEHRPVSDLDTEAPVVGDVQELTNVDVKDEAEVPPASEAARAARLLEMIDGDRGPFNAKQAIDKLRENPIDTP